MNIKNITMMLALTVLTTSFCFAADEWNDWADDIDDQLVDKMEMTEDATCQDDLKCAQELDPSIYDLQKKIATSFCTSWIKNNKIDIGCTLLALAMMASFTFIGPVPPHVASSSTLVHAVGSIINQKKKNKIYSDRLDDLKKLKNQLKQALQKSSGKFDKKKALEIVKTIENGIKIESISYKRTYILRLISSLAFMLGYFFYEMRASVKLYNEIYSETSKLMKDPIAHALEGKLGRKPTADEVDANIKLSAVVECVLNPFIRGYTGFSKDQGYCMYPWLIGAILEIANLDYIRCSNRDYSKTALDKVEKIKKLLGASK